MLSVPVPLPVATGVLALLFALQVYLSVKRGKESRLRGAMFTVGTLGFVALCVADLAAFDSTSKMAVGVYAGVTFISTIASLFLASRYLQYLMVVAAGLIGLFGFAAVTRFLYLLV